MIKGPLMALDKPQIVKIVPHYIV